MILKVRVGKKYAIYLPREVVERLGIEEGDVLLLRIKENTLVFKRIEKISAKVEYWGEVSPDEVEEVGEEISEKILG